MRPNTFLQELKATLLLTDSEQLLGSPLIRGKASHLPDQVPHKLVVLSQLALSVGWLGLEIL